MKFTLDSNILVYAVDSNSGDQHRVAAGLIARAAQCDCILTLQCLAEFFNVATRKAGLSIANAEVVVNRWRAVFPVYPAGESALVEAIDTVKRHSLSFWDAMLWATARQARCRLLLTEDMHDGQTIGGVTFVNPFLSKNATLLEAALSRP